MPKRILDTVVLRVLSFAHPRGLEVFFDGLHIDRARFPAEVYNVDEKSLPLSAPDDQLSELARGLRYTRRQANELPSDKVARYERWTANTRQIRRHMDNGRFVIDPLTIEELPGREQLMDHYGIGRGKAAGLVLARRYEAQAVFLSAARLRCRTRLFVTYSASSSI